MFGETVSAILTTICVLPPPAWNTFDTVNAPVCPAFALGIVGAADVV